MQKSKCQHYLDHHSREVESLIEKVRQLKQMKHNNLQYEDYTSYAMITPSLSFYDPLYPYLSKDTSHQCQIRNDCVKIPSVGVICPINNCLLWSLLLFFQQTAWVLSTVQTWRLILLASSLTKLNCLSYAMLCYAMVAKGKRTTGGLQSVSHSMSIPLKGCNT